MSTKKKILSVLTENKSTYISGEELSGMLGISRAAVWKAVSSLREEGYTIDAVTNKGYILVEKDTTITEESLRAALPARYKENPIHIFDTLDSTNNKAKQLALAGAPHGTIVMALQQTGGKGRLGRSFFSPREGLYISIIIKPDFDLSKSVLVTSAAAVAVAESIESVAGHKAMIKWVNDVYIDDKKVCGILTEGMTDFETGQIENIIIGIGINTSLSGFPEELLRIAGAVEGDYSPAILAAETISKTLDLMKNMESRQFIEKYKERNFILGEQITVYQGIYKTDPSEVPSRPARALDIDENGGLVVMYSDGSRETLTSGEVSIRRL